MGGLMEATNSRVRVEPNWPAGGYMVSRPVDDRNWDVNPYSPWNSYSTVIGGNWARGSVIRKFQPTIRPPMLGYYAYDPTDPNSWHQSQS